MAAAEKKRPREEKELVHRLKPFAKLQTADDFEVFTTDILCTFALDLRMNLTLNRLTDEAMLRKQIQELQSYRRLGLQTVADIDKYQVDLNNRRVSVSLTYITWAYSPCGSHSPRAAAMYQGGKVMNATSRQSQLCADHVSLFAYFTNLSNLLPQLRRSTLQTAHASTSLLQGNKPSAPPCVSYRSRIWLSRRPWYASTPDVVENYDAVKHAISSRSMSTRPVESGTSSCRPASSRSQPSLLPPQHQQPRLPRIAPRK